MTSSLPDADVKGNILGRTIYRPSLIYIAIYSCEVMKGSEGGGGESALLLVQKETKKPGLDRVKNVKENT